MAGTIEILPRTNLASSYTQSTHEAVDAGSANFGAIEWFLDPAIGIGDSTTVTLVLQHAAINEESAYIDISGTQHAFSNTLTSPVIKTFSSFARYLRTKVTISLGTGTNGVNPRGVLVLKEGT